MNFFSPPELEGVPPPKPPLPMYWLIIIGVIGYHVPCRYDFMVPHRRGNARLRARGSWGPSPPPGKQGGLGGGTPPNSGGEKKLIDPPPSMNFFFAHGLKKFIGE